MHWKEGKRKIQNMPFEKACAAFDLKSSITNQHSYLHQKAKKNFSIKENTS